MAKIMVVDDEPDIVNLVKKIFEREGHKVVTALDGAEALERLRKTRVDVVLVDFFMPVLSGRGLVEKIRADPKLKDLKLAFLTAASFGEEGKEELRKLGISDYIQKPFDNEDLVRRVNKIISE